MLKILEFILQIKLQQIKSVEICSKAFNIVHNNKTLTLCQLILLHYLLN